MIGFLRGVHAALVLAVTVLTVFLVVGTPQAAADDFRLRPTSTPIPVHTPTPVPIIPILTNTPILLAAPTATNTPVALAFLKPIPRDTPLPTATPRPTSTPMRAQSSAPSSGGSRAAAQVPTPTPLPKSAFQPSVPAPRTAPVVVVSPPAPVVAAGPPISSFSFVGGIGSLYGRLGAIMGDPVEAEHGNADDCNTQQLTTTGLAYWLCASAMPGFVALPEGTHHWALVADRLLEWFGAADDPPSDATDATQATPSAPTAFAGVTPPSCMDPSIDPASVCMLTDGASVLGYITSADGTNTYRLDIPQSQAETTAELTDLPADYDLYLADSTGQLLGESVQEGTTPEMIDMWLPGGTYYLYVHADPARDFDAESPYRLNLSLTTAVADAR
jgi:hypothetical protein